MTTQLETRPTFARHHVPVDDRVWDVLSAIGHLNVSDVDLLAEYLYVRRDARIQQRQHRGLHQRDSRRPIVPCTNCPRCYFFRERLISFHGNITMLMLTVAVGAGLVLGAGWRFASPVGFVVAGLFAVLVVLVSTLVWEQAVSVRRWRRQAARAARG